MSEQVEKALEWMREVVGQAFTEAQNGDTTLLNKLGFYPGLQYYINNVHGRPEITMTQWMHWHPQHVREIESLYESYLRQEEAAAHTARIATLEEKLATLVDQLKVLTEAQKPAPTPARKRKVAEAEAVAEEPEDEDAQDKEDDTAEQGQEEPEASADQAEEPEAES